MADTLQNVPLPAGTWVDLYDATGITVGVKLAVQNLGSNTIQLAVKATEPLATDGFNELVPGNDQYQNQDSDSGAWAKSLVNDNIVNVRIA